MLGNCTYFVLLCFFFCTEEIDPWWTANARANHSQKANGRQQQLIDHLPFLHLYTYPMQLTNALAGTNTCITVFFSGGYAQLEKTDGEYSEGQCSVPGGNNVV